MEFVAVGQRLEGMTDTTTHRAPGSLAQEFAVDPLDRSAQARRCGDHILGALLPCAACWTWHVANRKPVTTDNLRRVLGEQPELAGRPLDELAAFVAGAVADVDPRLADAWSNLHVRLDGFRDVLPMTRSQRRAVREVAELSVIA